MRGKNSHGENVRSEDVTQTLLHTDVFTHKRSYAETLLHANVFTHTEAFIHRFQSHTRARARFYTQPLLHTLAQNCHCKFCCGVHLTCKNKSSYTWQEQKGVWCGVEGKFFRRHLEEWNKINRSHEELRNIRRKLEWTRDSPQSQIAPTVQNDTWEVTFIRSCAEFKNIQKSCCDSRWKTAWWFLGWPHPITIQKIAGTFAQQLGWVFVGPCHPSAHGPPAKLRSFTSFQMVHTHTFTLHTHDFLYTDAFTFTHKRPYTQTHLHRDTFTHRRLYPRQRLRSRFYTRTLLQTDAFAHRGTFYTQTLVHKCLSTQTP